MHVRDVFLLMRSLDDLKKTDLFSFFGFSEVGRRPIASGLIEVRMKPGGFQEFIDASVIINRSGALHEAVLFLDREWIGSLMTVNPFGKDLAKSFVEAVTPDEDKTRAGGIVSTLWRITGSDDIVLRIRESEQTEPEIQEFLQHLVNVYLGTERRFAMDLSKTSVVMENVTNLGRDRLKIAISALSKET